MAWPENYQKMTPEEYLEWEAQQEFRHEYVEGKILAMTGASLPHIDITLSFYRALYSHLRQRGCRAYVSDAKVKDSKNNRYFYPDLVISCTLRISNLVSLSKILVSLLRFFLLVRGDTIATIS